MATPGFEDRHVHVSESVIRELRRLAIQGFVALPKRGIEVGGLLFGQPHGKEVQVTGFEEAPCEHRYGPSYALSETDRAQLSDLLAQRSGAKLRVIGFFRSFTSREPVIEEADEVFVRQHFPAGDFVFLMLQPLSPENCVASVRRFHDGRLLPDDEDRQPLTFDAPPASTAESELEENAAPALLPPSYRARARDADTAWAGERPARPRRWWIAAAILLALTAITAAGYGLWTRARQPRWTDLSLNAHPLAGKLEVSWNGGAPAALQATGGLLSVTDSEAHRNIELRPAEIRAGAFTLPASRGDVALRLILYTDGVGIAGDSLRLAMIANPTVPPQTTNTGEADRLSPPPPPQEAMVARSVVSPPHTVHEVQPRIPAGIRSRLREPVVIPVEVEVSERGRVVSAVSEGQSGDSVHRYLAEQAISAARGWRFSPARGKNGARVRSNKKIEFVFTP
jgi:hypothetical protein